MDISPVSNIAHALDFTESWPIHILFFEFIYPFISSVIECGGGGTRGNFGTGVWASILKPTLIIYRAFEKNQTIHILYFTESLPIYILFFEFLYPFISSCLQVTLITRKPAVCKCENKGMTGIWAKNMCIYMGVRKFGPFQFQKSRRSYTFFFLKKKRVSYTWVRWKMGLFDTHIRTMSYRVPTSEVLNHLLCRICWNENRSLQCPCT